MSVVSGFTDADVLVFSSVRVLCLCVGMLGHGLDWRSLVCLVVDELSCYECFCSELACE